MKFLCLLLVFGLVPSDASAGPLPKSLQDPLRIAVELVNDQETIGDLVHYLEKLSGETAGTLARELSAAGVSLKAPVPRLTYQGGKLNVGDLEPPIIVLDPRRAEFKLATSRWRYSPKQDLHWNFAKMRGLWEPFWRFKKKGPLSNVALAPFGLSLLNIFIADAEAAMNPHVLHGMAAVLGAAVATKAIVSGKVKYTRPARAAAPRAPAAPEASETETGGDKSAR